MMSPSKNDSENIVNAETSKDSSIITTYNNCYNKDTDFNSEIKNLRTIINTYETVLEERKNNSNSECQVQQEDGIGIEKIKVSRENEDEVIQLTHVLNEKIEQYQMFLKNLINQVVNEDSCERHGESYGDVKDLLNMINECYYSKECLNNDINDSIRPLLDRSKTAICEMNTQINSQSNLLTQYKCQCESYSRKLNEELKLSKKKDIKINNKNTDLNCLANGFQHILKEKEMIEYAFKKNTVEFKTLFSKNEKYKSTISDLESKVCCLVKRLDESQIANNINIENCNYLTTENSKLQIKVQNFDEICKQVRALENIIIGLENQNTICEDINASITKEKNFIEQKLKNINNELKCAIHTSECNLNTVKSELSCAQNELKNKNEENQSLKIAAKSLECDIENLRIDLQREMCTNENLVRLKSTAECQTETMEKQLLDQKNIMSEQDKLVSENKRLTNEICTQFTKSKFLLDEVNNLKRVNEKLSESVTNYEKMYSKSIDHKGIQTNMVQNIGASKSVSNECKRNSCSTGNKNTCPCKSYVSNNSCDCQCHTNDSQNESSLNKLASTCSCNNCSNCTGNVQLKCDCTKDIIKEKENLQNKLKVMEALSTDTKRKYYDMEQEMQTNFAKNLADKKIEYENKIEELNAQLETIEINLVYQERDLNNALKREQQLNELFKKMKEDQQNKDLKLKNEGKKIIILHNSLKKCKKQSEDIYKALQSENCKNTQLEKHVQAYDNLYKSQLKTSTDLEDKLDKIKINTKKEQKYCSGRRNSKDSEFPKSSKNNEQLSSNGNNITSETKTISSLNSKNRKNNKNIQNIKKTQRELELIDSLLHTLKKNTK